MGLLLLLGVSVGRGAEDAGTSALPLLRVGFGARAAALGDAYVGLCDDAGALWWNPGGLAQLRHSEVSFSHQAWFGGIRDEYLGLAYARRNWVLGTSMTYSGVGDIEGWNESNWRTSSATQGTAVFALSWARRLGRDLGVGVSAKGMYDRIFEITGTGGGLDLGLHYRPSATLAFGGVCQNLGPRFSYGGETFPLPMTFRTGISWRAFPFWLAVCDLELPRYGGNNIHLGTEVLIRDVLSLRCGYRNGPQDPDLDRYTLGFGVRAYSFALDYAFVPYGELGSTHRVWLGRQFGKVPEVGSVVVKVVDANTDVPLEAQVEVTGAKEAKATTDPITGDFRLKDIPVGNLKVVATREEYYPNSDSLKVERDRTLTSVIPLLAIPPGSIEGWVYDAETGDPVDGYIEYSGLAAGVVNVTPESGSYRISDLRRGSYALKVKPFDPKYYGQECTLEVEPGETTAKDFALLKEKVVIVLKGVNFETAKATLLPESYPVLDRAGRILFENPRVVVELAGHTDSRRIHTEEFPSNLELSQARAEAVRDYLLENYPIEPDRLIAKGYGATEPIASNDTEEGMAENRRTEFRVLGEK